PIGHHLVVPVEGMVRSLIALPPTMRMPSLLPAGDPAPLLAVQNGILHLNALTLRAHTPDWFSCNCLACDYDPAASCDFWLDCLATLFGGDSPRVQLLQEWFGYCLWPGFEAKRFLFLYGPSNSGKSTVATALQALIGAENVSNVTFADLAANR